MQINSVQSSKVYQMAGAALAAALIAGGVVGFPGLPEASATRTQSVTAAPLAAPVQTAGTTADRGWPYVQRAGNVRLVTTDRLN
ncbi:MAG: hypothetical protein KIT85_15885 [Pseudolabrys sp.]|nr:hypothetical protein [Pseudolabrys sp.]MCW5685883.1 hypothetical protein [Pseudolabrys sp.]